jgi:hypothetical protein
MGLDRARGTYNEEDVGNPISGDRLRYPLTCITSLWYTANSRLYYTLHSFLSRDPTSKSQQRNQLPQPLTETQLCSTHASITVMLAYCPGPYGQRGGGSLILPRVMTSAEETQ